MEPRR